MDLTGHTLLGKYEVEGLLGMGGMGAVWRGRHALTGRKIAIKVLDQSHLKNRQVTERFAREARAASAIQHPGIVEVLDIDETADGVPFMVMEFLEGETLASRIERRGRLEQEELVRLGVMLLEALEAAHEQGVIHRDLKPENIYVCPAGRRGEIIKILDFGISHMAADTEQKLTMTGSVLGTPHYMSPEQAMGENLIDHRADLYAAGVVLYECAVGDVPYDAPNYNKLLRLILDQDPPSPRERGAEISLEVEQVILWAMEKNRDRRIPSAREMRQWLLKADQGEAPPYSPRRSSLPAPRAAADARAASPETPRPAGTLPANRGVKSSLTDVAAYRPQLGAMGVEIDPGYLDDEASGQWDVSPTLMKRVAEEQKQRLESMLPKAPTTPPPDIDLDAPLRSGSHALPLALELDESALRSNTTPPPKMPSMAPAAPTASSSGSYAAVSTGSGSHPAVGTPARTVPSGIHSIPPRLSELSGGYTAQPAPEPEPPAWRRYLLFGVVGVALFAGLVFGIRALVQPGVDDRPVPPPVTSPERPPRPIEAPTQGPRWVSITVTGMPPGASLRLDGLPATSPFRVREGGQHVIEISAPGYEDQRIEFDADRNRTIPARLRPGVGTR